jgi:hypothetical protein
VWNYNVKKQGLYNDNIETIYNKDDMFHKLTRVMAQLRHFTLCDYQKPPMLAIVSESKYAHRYIAKSGKSTWVRPFNFERFSYPAKRNYSLVMDDRLTEILTFCKTVGFPFPPFLIYLTSGDEEIDPDEHKALIDYLIGPRRALIPEKLWMRLQGDETIMSNVFLYKGTPQNISEQILSPFFEEEEDQNDGLFHFNLGNLEIAYNISKKKRSFTPSSMISKKTYSVMAPSAELKNQYTFGSGSDETSNFTLDHHEAVFITHENSLDLRGIIEALSYQKDEKLQV